MHNEEPLDMIYQVHTLPQVSSASIPVHLPVICVVRLGTLAGAVEYYPKLALYWYTRLTKEDQ